MSKEQLLSIEAAAEELGLDDDGVSELIAAGSLRKVWHRAGNDADAPLEAFVLAGDIRKVNREKDPRYLASLLPRDGGGTAAADEDDPDDPRTLAADVPRL